MGSSWPICRDPHSSEPATPWIQIRHVLYTEPKEVTAGGEITMFYNPRDTPLNGRQRIFIQGGWNRWSHPRKFGPIEMTPPAEGQQHFQVTG